MQIPRTLTPEVGLNGLPGVKADAVSVEGTGAAQMQQFGGDLMRGSAMMGELGLKMQDDINRAIVADALNQAIDLKDRLTNDKDEGYTTLQGRNALDRPDGLSLTEEYAGKFDKGLQAIKGSLKNQAQVAMFNSESGKLLMQLVEGTRKHMTDQNKVYQDSVDNGSIAAGMRMVAGGTSQEDWDNGINYALNAASRKYMRQGLSAEEAQEKVRADFSPHLEKIIDSKLDASDVAGASEVVQRYGQFMDAKTLESARSKIEKTQQNIVSDELGKRLAETAENQGGVGEITVPDMGGGSGKGDAVSSFVNWLMGKNSKEYNGKGNPQNPYSSAYGWGQFINSTFLHYFKKLYPQLAAGKSDKQLLSYRMNKEIMTNLSRAYAEDNGVELRKYGLPVTAGTLYLAHFLGAGGAVSVLKANPNTPMSDSLARRQGVMKANPVLKGKTAGDVIAWAAKTIGDGGGGTKTIKFKSIDDVNAYIDSLPLNQRNKLRADFNQHVSAIRQVKKMKDDKFWGDVGEILYRSKGDVRAIPNSMLAGRSGTDIAKVEEMAKRERDRVYDLNFEQYAPLYYDLKLHPEKLGDMTAEEVRALAKDIGWRRTSELTEIQEKYFKDEKKHLDSPPKVSARVLNAITQQFGYGKFNKETPQRQKELLQLEENIRNIQQEYYQNHKQWPSELQLMEMAQKQHGQWIVYQKTINVSNLFGQKGTYTENFRVPALMASPQQKQKGELKFDK